MINHVIDHPVPGFISCSKSTLANTPIHGMCTACVMTQVVETPREDSNDSKNSSKLEIPSITCHIVVEAAISSYHLP